MSSTITFRKFDSYIMKDSKYLNLWAVSINRGSPINKCIRVRKFVQKIVKVIQYLVIAETVGKSQYRKS